MIKSRTCLALLRSMKLTTVAKNPNKHGVTNFKTGRGTVVKIPFMRARERGGWEIAEPVELADQQTATEFAVSKVSDISTVYLDKSKICNHLPFDHDPVSHLAGEYVRGDVYTNSMESVWAVQKRLIHGTWHRVPAKHNHRYVNEATIHVNEGNVEIHTIKRIDAMVSKSVEKWISYRVDVT